MRAYENIKLPKSGNLAIDVSALYLWVKILDGTRDALLEARLPTPRLPAAGGIRAASLELDPTKY